MAVLVEFDDEGHSSAADTVTETLDLFGLGYSVEQVAQRRGLKEDTVYTHLAKGLEAGSVRFEDILALSAREIADIEAVLLAMPEQQRNALKPVYEQLGGAYSYGLLRCVRAALQRRIK